MSNAVKKMKKCCVADRKVITLLMDMKAQMLCTSAATDHVPASKEWQLWWKANPKVAGWYCLTTSDD